jgi:hypothetical protein
MLGVFEREARFFLAPQPKRAAALRSSPTRAEGFFLMLTLAPCIKE